jgi:hypothetical protein
VGGTIRTAPQRMLEPLLIALIRISGGRLAEVFFGIGSEGRARICTFGHPIMWYAGDPVPQGPPHLDVELRLWSKGGHASTVLSVTGSRMREHMGIEAWKAPGTSTLDPSGRPVDLAFRLYPLPRGAPLPYSAGENLPLDLNMSRGWTKKVSLRIEAS